MKGDGCRKVCTWGMVEVVEGEGVNVQHTFGRIQDKFIKSTWGDGYYEFLGGEGMKIPWQEGYISF